MSAGFKSVVDESVVTRSDIPPVSGVVDSDDAPMSRRFPSVLPPPSSRPVALYTAPEAAMPGPVSGPLSGVAAPLLFRGEAGPGYWITGDEVVVSVAFSDMDGESVANQVVRLSPTGAWFKPVEGRDYPFDTPVEVVLQAGEDEIGPLWGRIIPSPSQGPEALLGVSFNDIPYKPARSILLLLRRLAASGKARLAHRPPRVAEIITQPARIASILKAVAGVGNHGRLVGGEDDLALRVEGLSDDGKTVRWAGSGAWGQGPFVVDLVGYNSVYRMSLSEARLAGDHVETPLPTCMERVRHRNCRRAEAQRLTVSFHHPIWTRLPAIKREVRDVSFGGLSFVTSLDTDMLFPGLSLPFLEVRGQGGELVRLRAEVRAISTSNGEDVVGLSVQPHASRDELRWHRVVADMLYPTTESGPEWVESLWDLFHTSGYFNLSGKSPEEFDRIRARFVEVGQKGACVPGLFCHAVVPSDRGVEATVSILKAYESTWMLHQLAKRPRQPGSPASRQLLRDLYVRAFEHTQTDRKLEWALAYAEATVPWNQQTHFAFAQKHAETQLAVAMPFQLMEVRSADRSVSGDSGFEIGIASEDEVRTILAVVAATRPRAYTEALDLVDERVDLGGVASHWRREGLSRERAILVARRGGVAVAAAIVESGETGTNLFRLLDGLRLIPLLLGGSAALPALLDGARAWFGARGKESFVYFREGEDPGPASITRLGDLGEGKLWIVAAEILPEFLEHVFEITSPRR